MAAIEIPLRTTDEVLVVNQSDLKDDETFLLELLSEEQVPSSIYAKISIEYWKQGLYQQFERFLKAGQAAEETLKGSPPVDQRSRVITIAMLGSYYIEVIRLISSGVQSVGGYSQRDLSQLKQSAKIILDQVTLVDADNISALLFKGTDEALSSFRKALSIDPSCIPALLGEEEYDKALCSYQKVVQLGFDIDTNVRIRMGICFYYLKMVQEALKSFQRVLEIDENNSDASLFIAAIEMQEFRCSRVEPSKRELLLQKINEIILKASKTCPTHPFLKYILSNILLFRMEPQMAQDMCTSAIESKSSSRRMHQRLLTCRARAYQMMDLEEAYALGNSTTALNYLLSQEYIFKGQTSKAISMLEPVLSKTKNSYYPTLKGFDQEKVKELISVIKTSKEYLSTEENHCSALEINFLGKIAMQCESLDIRLSLELYISATRKMKALGMKVPHQYYNNIGVLSFKLIQDIISSSHITGLPEPSKEILLDEPPLKEIDEFHEKLYNEDSQEIKALFSHSKYVRSLILQTQECYMRTLNIAKDDFSNDTLELKTAEATVPFNMAILRYSAGQIQSALTLCLELLRRHPSYIDNRLLLAQIYMENNQPEKCLVHLKYSIAMDTNNATSRLLLADYYSKHVQNYQEVKRCYDTVLREIDSNNPYALCSLGNLNLKFVKSAKSKEQRDAYLERALRLFDSALKKNHCNINAAIGIGIVLTEREQFAQAQMVFTQMEQAALKNRSFAINYALIHLGIDLHGSRISIPLKASKRKDGSFDPYALEILSRACYTVARETKEIYYMQLALKYIHILSIFEATIISPKYSNFFNLALVKQELSQLLCENTAGGRSLTDLEREMKSFEVPERIFTELSNKIGELKPKYIEYAKQKANFCKHMRSRAPQKIRDAMVLEKRRQEKLEEIRRYREQLESEKNAKRMEELNRLEQEEEAMHQTWEQLQQKLSADIAKLAELEKASQRDGNKYEENEDNQVKSKKVSYLSREYDSAQEQSANSESMQTRKPRRPARAALQRGSAQSKRLKIDSDEESDTPHEQSLEEAKDF